MPTNIRVIHANDFIIATPEGRMDLEASKKLLLEIASTPTPAGEHEVLLDVRKAQSDLSIGELWFLAAELGKLRSSFSGRTAVLCPPERFDFAGFFALCAQNRGLRVRAFTSFEYAIEWLVSKEA